jgi:glycosyltransferase involved in cell wall biosynthesis
LDIILVDDGSPDNCPAICDDWAQRDARIRVIHKQNQGLGMARNTGLDYARGEFICFVDSDDYLVPDAVERCVSALEEFKADTLLFGRYDAFPDGTVVDDCYRVVKKHYAGEQIMDELLPELFTCGVGYGVSACSKVFSVKIFNDHKIRFKSEREIISEDAFFCLDYFPKTNSVLVIPDRFYCYYKNANSLSRVYREDRQRKNNVFLMQSLLHLREMALPETLEVYLKSKYHVFSLAAMKHIVISELSKADQKAELRKIYKDEIMRSTLALDVLRIDSVSIAILMFLIKIRAYCLCDFLIRLKA